MDERLNMKKRTEKKSQKRYISLFAKSVMILFGIALVPLMVMGISTYNAYSSSIRESLLSNKYQSSVYVGKNITDLMTELESCTEYLYEYQISEYDYFYEIIEDKTLSESKKETLISDVLQNILYKNEYISHVYFIRGDQQYAVMKPPESIVDSQAMALWHGKFYEKNNLKMRIIPTHTQTYYPNLQEKDFSVVKNIMNTKTVESAQNEILGTLYLDVNIDYFATLLQETGFSDKDQIYIVDREQQTFIYSPNQEQSGEFAEEFSALFPKMLANKQYIRAGNDFLIYSSVPGTNWLIIERVPVYDLEHSYYTIRNSTLIIIGIGIVLLLLNYGFYAKTIDRPIRALKTAMEEIQSGNLDARVQISSKDEMRILADGLNQMAERLQTHIRQVYLAQIQQRDAEIDALNMQIQPHYLYNTLDVIRMTAVTHDDMITAEMLESLSSQLKYLMAGSRDLVPLKKELDSIRNYFKIIRIRNDNRFDLEINVEEQFMRLSVPQLMIQPVVENAIKYGLKPKNGGGVISIYAKMRETYLEITVMDNGGGMPAKRLKYVQELLEDQNAQKDKSTHVGLKNVDNRIKLLFGEEYGLEINSSEGIGTIVKYHLPVMLKTQEETERLV